jgi:hypothetical protein
MTTQELEQAAEELAARRNDPRTPAIVRRAILAPSGLTLRRYLLLEEMGSPLLTGEWPVDAGEFAEAFLAAWEIFNPGEEPPEPAAIGAALEGMVAEVTRGFGTVMPMQMPRRHGAGALHELGKPDALGWLTLVWARCVTELHLSPEAAQELPLEQIFILLAGAGVAAGMECTGQDYRERELL